MLPVILLISGLSLVSGVFSKIETGLTNTIAKVGDTVVFSFVTRDKGCSNTDWSKQEGIQSAVAIYKSSYGMLNNNIYPLNRYSVSPVNGTCSLTILDLKLNDSGLYSCSEAQERHFVLAVVEHDEKCQTDATTGISNGTMYTNICKVKFNPNFIIPWKMNLSWKNPPLSVNSTGAATVELAYTESAAPTDVLEFECTGSLYVEQPLQKSHDDSLPSFQACTLPSITVHYPVTKINCTNKFGKEKLKFRKSEIVKCVPDGYPLSTCECKSNKANGKTENCSQFVIPDTSSPEDTYTCTATNTFSPGKPSTVTVILTVTEEVTEEETEEGLVDQNNQNKGSLSTGAIVAIVIVVIIIVILTAVGVYFGHRKLKSGNSEKKGESVLPLKMKETESAPPKPPRASTNSNQIYRPQSDVLYAQLAKEENPRMIPANRTNQPPSTIYAQVNKA